MGFRDLATGRTLRTSGRSLELPATKRRLAVIGRRQLAECDRLPAPNPMTPCRLSGPCTRRVGIALPVDALSVTSA